MKKLSVVLLTRNEEENIRQCLESVKDITDEIIVLDENSKDMTAEIAKGMGAKVYEVAHQENFHINKKKALEMATGDWILQLDADERVTKKLKDEIQKVLEMDDEVLEDYEKNLKEKRLFERHQKLIEERDGRMGKNEGKYVAFFVPRLNLFLGKYLRYGGVYPDGVIRLVKKGYAYFPAKSVHEQIAVEGRVGWLQNALVHTPDKNFKRYLRRNSYYIKLLSNELEEKRIKKDFLQFVNYVFYKPLWWFLLTQLRHKGILDGWQGVVFSFFSALRFPRAYLRYILGKSEKVTEKRKYRVAVDTGPLSQGHSVRGIGVNTRELIKKLQNIEDDIIDIQAVDFKKTDLSNYDLAHYQYFHPYFLSLPLRKRTKTIVTIHDLIYLIYANAYPPGIKGSLRFLLQKYLIKKVDGIITISETSKKDIMKYLQVKEDKIHVIYLAPKEVFKPVKDTKTLGIVKKKYNLPDSFVLYVGGVNYNKNLMTLADACKNAKVKLVLVGKATKDEDFDRNHPENRPFAEFLDKYGKDEDVKRLGFVEDDELNSIYSLATLYCQPSLNEGFGLGVLEAQAAGCPTIASDIGAHREIAKDSVLFFDPSSFEDLSNKIKKAIESQKLRSGLIKNSLSNVKKYSWEKTAKETLKIYKKVIGI